MPPVITTDISRLTPSELFGDGSAVVPALAFLNDKDTGFYRPASGRVGFVSNGTEMFRLDTGGLLFLNDVRLILGNGSDISIINRSTTLNANTILASVIVGTPVTPALAAKSLIISNITADGDILVAANRGGNSENYIYIDASAGTMRLTAPANAALTLASNNVDQVVIRDGFLHQVDGILTQKNTITADTTDGDVVYTAAQVLSGYINRSGITVNRNDSMPTAADLVAAIPGAVVGTSFWFIINNNDDASTITMSTASAGITYDGDNGAIAAGDAVAVHVVLTNVTGASEAATATMMAH